eukprot:g9214.t1
MNPAKSSKVAFNDRVLQIKVAKTSSTAAGNTSRRGLHKASFFPAASVRSTLAPHRGTTATQQIFSQQVLSEEGCKKYLATQRRLLDSRRTELVALQKNFMRLRELERTAFAESQRLHKALVSEEHMNRTLVVSSLAPFSRETTTAHAVYNIMIAACQQELLDIAASAEVFRHLQNLAAKLELLRRNLKQAKEKRLSVKFSQSGLFWDSLFRGLTKADQMCETTDRIAILKRQVAGTEAWLDLARQIAVEELKILRLDRAQKWKNAQEEFVARQQEIGSGMSRGVLDVQAGGSGSVATAGRGVVSKADLVDWGLDSHEFLDDAAES